MLCKRCPYCGKQSFSATDAGKWYCPYCGKELSNVKTLLTSSPKKHSAS